MEEYLGFLTCHSHHGVKVVQTGWCFCPGMLAQIAMPVISSFNLCHADERDANEGSSDWCMFISGILDYGAPTLKYWFTVPLAPGLAGDEVILIGSLAG